MHRYTAGTGLREFVMVLVAAIYVIPLYVLVNLSLKSTSDSGAPFSPALHPTGQNYIDAWTEGSLGSALITSAVITIASVVLIVIVSAMAAYPLARVTKAWSTAMFGLFMVGLFVPYQLALLPLYSTMRALGLLGNDLGLILFYVGSQVPFSIFLYTGFLREVPLEYEEAAAVDGAKPFRTFFSVVFPLVRPVTGTVIILNALLVWNDFLTPLLYLAGQAQQTLPLAVFSFVGHFVTQWNLVFAGLIISVAPILILYFFFQGSIIKGFTSGLKG